MISLLICLINSFVFLSAIAIFLTTVCKKLTLLVIRSYRHRIRSQYCNFMVVSQRRIYCNRIKLQVRSATVSVLGCAIILLNLIHGSKMRSYLQKIDKYTVSLPGEPLTTIVPLVNSQINLINKR